VNWAVWLWRMLKHWRSPHRPQEQARRRATSPGKSEQSISALQQR